MSNKVLTVERALAELQRVVREPDGDPPPPHALGGVVPEDLQTEQFKWLSLYAPEARALYDLRRVMLDDERFEWMGEQSMKDATWRFACELQLPGAKGLAKRFIAEHAQEPMRRSCHFPVSHLTVDHEVEIARARVIPRDKTKDGEAGSVIAVQCSGTDYGAMAARARPVALHALRVLRASLRDVRFASLPLWTRSGAGPTGAEHAQQRCFEPKELTAGCSLITGATTCWSHFVGLSCLSRWRMPGARRAIQSGSQP